MIIKFKISRFFAFAKLHKKSEILEWALGPVQTSLMEFLLKKLSPEPFTIFVKKIHCKFLQGPKYTFATFVPLNVYKSIRNILYLHHYYVIKTLK